MPYEKEISYESSRQLELIRSRKVAWIIASIAAVLAILSVLSIFIMLPLKTVVPYVIKENTVTGDTRIVKILNQENLSLDEATHKFFASDYVKKREQYYFNILSKDYYQVLLYSNDIVQNNYKKIYDGENGRNKLLSDRYKVEVEILGVVLSESAGSSIATVRSKITTTHLRSIGEKTTSFLTSTVAYTFNPQKQMNAEDSLLNPLGFTVNTYRRDKEVNQ